MPSLFDTPDTWQHDPAKAFDAFVVSSDFIALSHRKPASKSAEGVPLAPAPLRASSVLVYRAMFGKFLRFLAARDVTLFLVSDTDLLAFLESQQEAAGKLKPVLRSRIKYKYLRLLERVYTHLGVLPNPAQHACFAVFQNGDRSKVGQDARMVALSEAEQVAFLGGLPTTKTNNWKVQRNRAMQAMMLGAGLKVSEVVGMRVENVGEKDVTGCVPITISPGSNGGIARWHQTQLRAFAVPEVLAWLDARCARKIAGPLLFPAGLQGGRLDPATVYRQVKATFARAGIAVPRLGGRTLRNSFAVRELQGGAGVELVGEFLGHRRRRSINEYCAAAMENSTG